MEGVARRRSRRRVWRRRLRLLVPLAVVAAVAVAVVLVLRAGPGRGGPDRLIRHMSPAPRATLFAADRTPLAKGPDRTSPIADVAGQIAGVLGPIPAADEASYTAQGYPAGAKVGQNGLERAFQV